MLYQKKCSAQRLVQGYKIFICSRTWSPLTINLGREVSSPSLEVYEGVGGHFLWHITGWGLNLGTEHSLLITRLGLVTPSLLALDSSYLLTRHFSLLNLSLVPSQWRLRRPDLSRISIEDYWSPTLGWTEIVFSNRIHFLHVRNQIDWIFQTILELSCGQIGMQQQKRHLSFEH